uniref:Uncharacterized protein n=1 Tax=Zea mays TaxID=4577 RepID=B6T0N1_MAIZE|nr:hypothetical protein [Zea mays]
MDTSLVQQWPLLTSALAWVCMTREMSPPSSFPRAWIEGSSSLSVCLSLSLPFLPVAVY